MKKVSIVVPVYNVENYLDRCLDSLINQTFKDIEIILINDGSTDKSLHICTKYVKKYPDIFILISKENEGQGIARNLGIDKSSGKYIMFVDSDDWISNDMVMKMYKIATSSNADIVWAPITHVEHGEEAFQMLHNKSNDEIKSYILNNAGPCGKLIKRNIIIKNNLYFPKIRAYEDIAIVPLWGLYAKNIRFVDEKLYYYNIHLGSTMKQVVYSKKLEDIFASLDNLYNSFENSNLYFEELEFLFIDHLLHGASLRFFQFNNYKENIHKISKIMRKRFPNWKKNVYYKSKNIKYRLICILFYSEQYCLLKIILKNKI